MQREGAGSARRSWLGWLGMLAVVLVAVQAFRSAFVAALGEQRPAAAHAMWPSHPLPQVTLALASIGAAAREGKQPNAEALERMRSAGRVDPLAVDPLLVDATARLASGDQGGGERLLKAALHREPRSWAAHFLLADLYVRQQRVGDALVHVGVLGRRLRGGGGAEAFAAALAVYLRDPAKVPEVRRTLSGNADLRAAVLNSLAQDPAGAASLRGLTRRGDAGANWFRLAFERNLMAGNVAEARALLTAVGVGRGTALTPWAAKGETGPLSWSFPASTGGVAEPVAGGPLRLLYYGRGDTILASHLLLLPPGPYRLAAQFAGAVPAGSFEWRVTCLQGERQLATWPVEAAESAHAMTVGADCPAQRLALWSRMQELPRTVTAELSRVSLDPIGPPR